MIIEAILIGIFLIAVMLFLVAMFEVRHRMAERRATIEWLGNARRAFISGPHPRHNIPTVHISDTGRATHSLAAEDIFRRFAEQVEGERAADGDDPHLGT